MSVKGKVPRADPLIFYIVYTAAYYLAKCVKEKNGCLILKEFGVLL